jgi:hypothetical protein
MKLSGVKKSLTRANVGWMWCDRQEFPQALDLSGDSLEVGRVGKNEKKE